MALATLAAAERLLVLGEPVGALLLVSYKQQFISHTLDTRDRIPLSYKTKAGYISTHHWSSCCRSGLFGKQRLQFYQKHLVIFCLNLLFMHNLVREKTFLKLFGIQLFFITQKLKSGTRWTSYNPRKDTGLHLMSKAMTSDITHPTRCKLNLPWMKLLFLWESVPFWLVVWLLHPQSCPLLLSSGSSRVVWQSFSHCPTLMD